MAAGLHSSLLNRGWEGSPISEGVGEEKTGAPFPCPARPPRPPHHSTLGKLASSVPGHFHVISLRKLNRFGT